MWLSYSIKGWAFLVPHGTVLFALSLQIKLKESMEMGGGGIYGVINEHVILKNYKVIYT